MKNFIVSWISSGISFMGVVSLLVSMIALIIAYKSFKFKKGVGIRGRYTMDTYACTKYLYVNSLILENYKDRSITIYGIYLNWGKAEYLEVEQYKEPIILNAFETKNIEFGYKHVEMYLLNNRRVNIINELESKNIKKKLIVSTSEGKCIVDINKIWKPKENKIIKCWAEEYKGRCYPNAKFVIVYRLYGEDFERADPVYEGKGNSIWQNISTKEQLAEKVKEHNEIYNTLNYYIGDYNIIEIEKDKEDKYGKEITLKEINRIRKK